MRLESSPRVRASAAATRLTSCRFILRRARAASRFEPAAPATPASLVAAAADTAVDAGGWANAGAAVATNSATSVMTSLGFE
ncbi:hypothetical protein WL05_19640 [Burkholderia ubonensis]|nr:hypothetical protein WL05_19640 [Burkholderia ubonensis]KVX94004.1 hypothetical protein WL10_10080 [Burkholderia ubonensis]